MLEGEGDKEASVLRVLGETPGVEGHLHKPLGAQDCGA